MDTGWNEATKYPTSIAFSMAFVLLNEFFFFFLATLPIYQFRIMCTADNKSRERMASLIGQSARVTPSLTHFRPWSIIDQTIAPTIVVHA